MQHERPSASAPAAARAAGWLRARLLPRGANAMLLAAYAVILTALIAVALLPGELPLWRYSAALLALGALLALNMMLVDLQGWLGERRGMLALLALGGALFLIAELLAAGPGASFVHFIMFVLASQAVAGLGLRAGLAYIAALLACWVAVIAGGAGPADLLAIVSQVVLGMVFTVVLSYVVALFQEQTQRAERLLADLQRANVALEEARRREHDLATDQERLRLAREIHDGLGHYLTALHVQLQAAERLIGHDQARAAETIAICRAEAQAALQEVRRSVAAMRAGPPAGASPEQAIAALARDFGRAADIAVDFEQEGAAAELGPATAATLYRAAQEGLTNAQKHAGAARVLVRLSYGAGQVRLLVRDDGAAAQAAPGGGFGLAGLRERAEQLGGTLRAAPQPGGGFALEIALPASERGPR